VEIAVVTVAKWPMAVLDPNQKSTTDRYLAAPGFIHTPNSLSFNPAAAQLFQ
jgi:hypothetical protein